MSNIEHLNLEFSIEDERWTDQHCAVIETAILRAASVELGTDGPPAELSILLTNDVAQHALNKQWRQKDSSTNVLSFPQIEPFSDPAGLLGDVSFAYETIIREADEQAKTLDHHLAHLAVHSFLHILGYDHISDSDALEMERRETDILATMNIANPYAPLDNE